MLVITVRKTCNLKPVFHAIDSATLDSMIQREVEARRKLVDTPVVVINADARAYYVRCFM